jgi:hypothetical protein
LTRYIGLTPAALIALGTTGRAAANEPQVDAPQASAVLAQPPDVTPENVWDTHRGMRAAAGRAYVFGVSRHEGYIGRIEADLFEVKRVAGCPWKPVGGVALGLEAWYDRGDWGVGMPFVAYLGYRLNLEATGGVALTGMIGAGFSGFTVDEMRDRLGLGVVFAAPRATADLGIDLLGFKILAEATAQYRWRWNLVDAGILSYGLALGYDLGPRIGHIHPKFSPPGSNP